MCGLPCTAATAATTPDEPIKIVGTPGSNDPVATADGGGDAAQAGVAGVAGGVDAATVVSGASTSDADAADGTAQPKVTVGEVMIVVAVLILTGVVVALYTRSKALLAFASAGGDGAPGARAGGGTHVNGMVVLENPTYEAVDIDSGEYLAVDENNTGFPEE